MITTTEDNQQTNDFTPAENEQLINDEQSAEGGDENEEAPDEEVEGDETGDDLEDDNIDEDLDGEIEGDEQDATEEGNGLAS